jgi:hypothetical protein
MPRIFFVNIFIFLLYLLAVAETNVSSGNSTGFFISGNGQFSPLFVKSSAFPVGTQLAFQYGGLAGYSFPSFEIALRAAFHSTFYSFESDNVLYRKFKGYTAGFEFRKHFSDRFSLFHGNVKTGAGLCVDGVFDKYELVSQYMYYTKATLEIYGSYVFFPRWKHLFLTIVVPVSYSFRSSGNYLQPGVSLETSLHL